MAVEIKNPHGVVTPAAAHSEGVGRSAVLSAGLEVVMLLAQRLPVVLVPEQTRITTVRNDVINHGSLHVPRRVFFQALHTKWVFLKEQSTCLLPSATIATV